MAQEYIQTPETQLEQEEIHEALTRCKHCNHIVPKTMGCLYCGKPILFKNPEKEKKDD
ncbi:hypothetical protein GF326_06305 [Candidatus Bathyarchaeota archaeon]|jgi:rRNA maturation endonuclease Nob1|nr:hypothetical protein [Candidatus Bathyarchaeota archaeon]